MSTPRPSDTYEAVLEALADVAAPTYAIGWGLGIDTDPVAAAPAGASARHRAELAALSLYHLWGRINAECHRRAADNGINNPPPGNAASIRARLNVAYMAIMDGERQRAVRTLRHLALDARDMCEDQGSDDTSSDKPGRMIEACPNTATTTTP